MSMTSVRMRMFSSTSVRSRSSLRICAATASIRFRMELGTCWAKLSCFSQFSMIVTAWSITAAPVKVPARSNPAMRLIRSSPDWAAPSAKSRSAASSDSERSSGRARPGTSSFGRPDDAQGKGLEQAEAAQQVAGERVGIAVRVEDGPRLALLRREEGGPGRPVAAARSRTGDAHVRLGKEGLVEAAVRERPERALADLGVALPHHPEGVLVEAEPDVQAVVEDAAVLVADRGGLAAQPPAAFVDVDDVAGLSRELPGGRHSRAPAADDRDPFRCGI